MQLATSEMPMKTSFPASLVLAIPLVLSPLMDVGTERVTTEIIKRPDSEHLWLPWLEPLQKLPRLIRCEQVVDLQTSEDRAATQGYQPADDKMRAVPAHWHNTGRPLDVNDDGVIAALDVLTIVNYLNTHPGASSRPTVHDPGAPFCDVNADQLVTPIDVLAIINYLNHQVAGDHRLAM